MHTLRTHEESVLLQYSLRIRSRSGYVGTPYCFLCSTISYAVPSLMFGQPSGRMPVAGDRFLARSIGLIYVHYIVWFGDLASYL